MLTYSQEVTTSVREKYRVESVVKADAPEGMDGDDWHQYTIVYGKTSIQGLKPGSLFSVTQHAEEFAENLNERTSRYGNQAYRSKKK